MPPQNNAALGSTVHYVIPKSADLLGPIDLMVDFNTAIQVVLREHVLVRSPPSAINRVAGHITGRMTAFNCIPDR